MSENHLSWRLHDLWSNTEQTLNDLGQDVSEEIFRLSKEEMKASRTSMPYVAFPGQSPIPKARGKTLKSLRRKLTGKNK